jgi:lycopene cyclase domain-containing protein
MEFLIIEIVLSLIVFLIHRHYKVRIFKSKKQLIAFWLITLILGGTWDNFAVYRGHWFYPGTGIMGIKIGLIPIEDYIFMFVVGYTFLVMYTVSNKLIDEYRKKRKKKN